MFIPKDYVVVYRSDDGYQIADFGTFTEAVEFCLAGQTYTSEYFIARVCKVTVVEQ